jgi:hypothetical protein
MADATPGGGNGVDPAKEQQAEETAKKILTEGATSDAPEMPEDYQYLPQKLQLLEIQLKKDFAQQEIKLKESYATQEIELRATYAKGLLAILAVELVMVNVIFWKYAAIGEHWNIPVGVIQVWLGATVVQVVGVVTVVTRYLFPNRDSQPEPPALPQPPSS